MAIFEERILEQFMPRGMGSSGVASREIQASNLPDLSAAVRTSAMTRQNQEINLKNTLLSQRTSVKPKVSGGIGKPVVIGKSQADTYSPGTVTVAMPNSKGTYDLISLQTSYSGLSRGTSGTSYIGGGETLKSMGITGEEISNAPNLGSLMNQGEFSKNQIAEILTGVHGFGVGRSTGTKPTSISDILNRLPSSTAPVAKPQWIKNG